MDAYEILMIVFTVIGLLIADLIYHQSLTSSIFSCYS